MPTYRFMCQVCGVEFEKQLSIHESKPSVRCPVGHEKVRRLFSAPAVVFKGSGWYSTDHRKNQANSNS